MIDRFFSGKKTAKNDSPLAKKLPCRLAPGNITVEMLKELIPIRNLDEDELSSFALNRQSEVFGKGTLLFKAGQNDSSVMYLLKGTVVVDDEGGQKYEVNSGTTKARFPLASGKTFCATAYAKTDVSVLRVSKKIMTTSSADGNGHADEDKDSIEIPNELSNSRLFQLFVEHYRKNELTLPTLPDVAI
ncbi:MAG: cyclic nucleotide-binding domain-containing protein, partial [Pseudomonadota bacterium]